MGVTALQILHRHKPSPRGLGNGLHPVLDLELREDMAHLGLDGLVADLEGGGDLAIRAAGDHEPQHVKLARRERVECSVVGRESRHSRIDIGSTADLQPWPSAGAPFASR